MKTLLKGVTNTTLPNYTPVFGELLANTDTMSVQAGDDVTPGGVTVSGVIGFVVVTPSLSSPVDGDVLRVSNLTITTTSFDGQGEHASTRYQIATDALFTQVVFNRDDAVNLLSIVPADHGFTPLDDVTYYIRAQHNSSVAGLSDWSTVVVVTLRRDLPLTYSGEVLANDRLVDDFYGYSVDFSADGSTMIVGAIGIDVSTLLDVGGAYVYERDNAGVYVQTAKLAPSGTAQGDYYGMGCAISDDGLVMVVGAAGVEHGATLNSGVIYIYTRPDIASAFVVASTKTPEVISANGWYGCRIALSGDANVLAVCTYGYVASGLSNAGAVLTYIRDNTGAYIYKETITAEVPATSALFGFSAALTSDGSILAIGEPGFTSGGVANAGKVNIYRRQLDDTFLFDTSFVSHVTPITDARFGVDVSFDVDGSLLMIGAHRAPTGAILSTGMGFLYEYLAGTYTHVADYSNDIPVDSESFSVAVAISRDAKIAVAGAINADSNRGSTTLFKPA